MNNLFINGENVGHCSRPRARGYGEAYSFLMEGGYYIHIEYHNVKSFVTIEKDNDNIDYMIETYG